jgi:hypothetical protein
LLPACDQLESRQKSPWNKQVQQHAWTRDSATQEREVHEQARVHSKDSHRGMGAAHRNSHDHVSYLIYSEAQTNA